MNINVSVQKQPIYKRWKSIFGRSLSMGDLNSIDLENMKSVDIRTIDPDSLVNIEDAKINTDLPKQERILDYIKQIKNPYCFKCGKVIVKVSFSNTEVTLEDRLEGYLMTL